MGMESAYSLFIGLTLFIFQLVILSAQRHSFRTFVKRMFVGF